MLHYQVILDSVMKEPLPAGPPVTGGINQVGFGGSVLLAGKCIVSLRQRDSIPATLRVQGILKLYGLAETDSTPEPLGCRG